MAHLERGSRIPNGVATSRTGIAHSARGRRGFRRAGRVETRQPPRAGLARFQIRDFFGLSEWHSYVSLFPSPPTPPLTRRNYFVSYSSSRYHSARRVAVNKRSLLREVLMPMERVLRDSALTKAVFHERLRHWLDSTEDARVGSKGVPGVTPWVYVRDGAQIFALNADTPRDAVRQYLHTVTLHGEDLTWEIFPSQRGKNTAVVYGPDRLPNTSFYLYAKSGGPV